MITDGELFSGPQSELSRVGLNNQPMVMSIRASNRLIAAREIFLTEPRMKAIQKFWWAPLIREGSTFVDCEDGKSHASTCVDSHSRKFYLMAQWCWRIIIMLPPKDWSGGIVLNFVQIRVGSTVKLMVSNKNIK